MNEQDIALCAARVEAMLVLLEAGWEPERIALALGMRASWVMAQKLMRGDPAWAARQAAE